MTSSDQTFIERNLNAQLADALRDTHNGFVRYPVGDLMIGVVARRGQMPAQQREAVSQANRILVNGQCDIAVAVVMPSDDANAGKAHVNARFKPFAYDEPIEQQLQTQGAYWDVVDIDALFAYLDDLPAQEGTPEALASMADIAIESALHAFNPIQRTQILRAVGITDIKEPDKTMKGLMTDLMAAMMFHSKLDAIGESSQEPQPTPLIDCLNSRDIHDALKGAHRLLGERNQQQILGWSRVILDALPPTMATRSALSRMASTALDIERTTGSEHHDLFGITFCQTLETAKNDGSMYTTIPAATLLSRLMLTELEGIIDWTDYDQVTGLRVVDFACGTGTLLIAAANYMLRRERTGRRDEVARALLEQVMHGYDINERALLQSATGLGMISPGVASDAMHLHQMPLGVDPESGIGVVGSLEMMNGLDKGPDVGVGKFDVAIMNPPFTVQDKRHQQFPNDVKAAIKQREGELTEGTASHRSGNSGAFVVLADRHLDERRGLLAFVLPSATANAPSAERLRVWLAERFHIKYLVVSYDPARTYFSGNTKIGEMLVVAGRRLDDESRPTLAVKLTSNPSSARTAAALAHAIADRIDDAYDHAELDEIPHARMAEGDWRALQFTDTLLYRYAMELTSSWEGTLGEQFDIRDIGAPISIHGDRLDDHEPGATPALWAHDAHHCNQLAVEPDSWVKPKPGHEREFSRHAGRLHRLKLPERISLTSSCATAVLTSEPSLGMAWQNAVPVRVGPHSECDVEKAAAVMLNSTLGKLAALLERNNRKSRYPHFSIAAQRRIRMPVIADLTPVQVGLLVHAFDRFATVKRKPFPEAHTCDVQKSIDDTVCAVLGFDSARCAEMRDRLALEPMISDKRYRSFEG